jgi:prolipoprotein diacylglyceryltransferase
MTIAIEPVLFIAGPLQVRWSAVFVALALVAGLVVARRWAAAAGQNSSSAVLAAALAVAAGVIVGRAAVLVERPDLLRRGVAFAGVIAQGGISLPAAALGGAAALTVWSLLIKQSPARSLAAAAGGLLVGEAIASIGLLVSGDYAGPVAEVPWAVSYARPDAGVPATLVGRHVHPLALYALIWSGVSVSWLWLAWPSRTISERWSLGALAFGLGHLLVGYARIDPVWLVGLRADQLFGLVWVVLGAARLIAGTRPLTQVGSPAAQQPLP